MTDQNDKRAAALKRLKAKQGFKIHAAIYLLVNALLLVIWATTTGERYFWPGWPMLGWGLAVAIHGWSTYLRKPISEDDIRREMERGG